MDEHASNSQALEAFASLAKGLLFLYISIFTLTVSHWALPYIRLVLAPAALTSFWHFGYGPYDEPTRLSPTIALYFMMRVLEHSVITFFDPRPPLWAISPPSSGMRVVFPLPNTFLERCIYAFDLLTSVRGKSWFTDWEWNWIPRSLRFGTPISRGEFVLKNIKSFLVQYLIFDLCDVIFRTRSWNFDSPYPITNLPVAQQVIFSITVCVGMSVSMSSTYTLVSLVFVLCGSSPSAWPRLFDSPFSSKTLGEFWIRRWHIMFRRVFERMSLPFMKMMGLHNGTRAAGRIANIWRSFIIFVLSTLLHLIIMQRLNSLLTVQRTGETGNPPFFDGSIIRFFLLQPLGLLVECNIVAPLADWMFPPHTHTQGHQSPPTTKTPNGHVKDSAVDSGPSPATGIRPPVRWERDALTRLFTWVFLVWTGRWWCDALVRAGFLDKDVKAVPVSILRGLWEGRWVM